MLLATAGKEAVDDAMRTGDGMMESVVLGHSDSLECFLRALRRWPE